MFSHVLTRRQALQQLACGIGGIGLANLLAEQGFANDLPAAPSGAGRAQGPHHPAKAKSLIFLNMGGGPSQFESFDYKPSMDRYAGKDAGGTGFNRGAILPSQVRFHKRGQSGLEISELFPRLSDCADDLCVIKSMVCDDINHLNAMMQIKTGFARVFNRPSFGSWILYGLGTENRNLPGFIYLGDGGNSQSGFLPAQNQGMPLSNRLPNLVRPNSITESEQRGQLDMLDKLNAEYAAAHDRDSDLAARIEAGELAFRMQMAAPEALDISHETQATQEMYGLDVVTKSPGAIPLITKTTTAQFGAMCLTARRLVERNVRVVVVDGLGRTWDQHHRLKAGLSHNAALVDQPVAGLLKDLKNRGLLESTLVLWGGEFGRTPSNAEGDGDGRNHQTKGYTMWLAGGGVRGGMSYGQTNELGTDVVENKVRIHDLHATLLWLMGLDHTRLTYRYGGRDQRLTDLYGNVVRAIMT